MRCEYWVGSTSGQWFKAGNHVPLSQRSERYQAAGFYFMAFPFFYYFYFILFLEIYLFDLFFFNRETWVKITKHKHKRVGFDLCYVSLYFVQVWTGYWLSPLSLSPSFLALKALPISLTPWVDWWPTKDKNFCFWVGVAICVTYYVRIVS